MRTTEGDVIAIVDRAMDAEIAKGTVIHHVGNWKRAYRARVIENESTHPGYVGGMIRAMSDQSESSAGPPAAAVVLRRLYDAKVGELKRYGVREPERTRIAVDYACSSIHTLRHAPFPAGGIGQLEDELYDAIGFSRVTGLRHTPRAS